VADVKTFGRGCGSNAEKQGAPEKLQSPLILRVIHVKREADKSGLHNLFAADAERGELCCSRSNGFHRELVGMADNDRFAAEFGALVFD
jgi:hypothetical protein